MQYDPPSFRRPQQYDVPASLDAIFSQYQQITAQKQAAALQDVNMRKEFNGENPLLMTPEARARGFAGPTVTSAIPEVAAVPPTLQTFRSNPNGEPTIGTPAAPGIPGRAGVPEHIQFENDVHEANLQRWKQKRDAGASAELDYKKSESAKNYAAAGRGSPGSGVQLNPQQSAALQWGIHQGFLAPEELTSRGPKTQILADGIAGRSDFQDWFKSAQATGKTGLEGFNPRAQDAGFGAQKAGLASTAKLQGGKGFEISANVGSLDDTLRQMEPLVSKLSPGSLQILNNAYQKGEAWTNDADANKILALANSARGLYSQVIAGGAGTVESDKKANETIARGLNAEGFKGMKSAVLAEGYSRAGRMSGHIPNTAEKPDDYIDPSAGMVRVVSPDGKSGMIPRANLAKAMQRGFKETR